VLHSQLVNHVVGRLPDAPGGARNKTAVSDAAGKLEYHLYYWIGVESSIDEMGTAAFKTVELSHKLDCDVKQLREVQYEESGEFQALFQPKVEYLPGGVPSGFRQVISDCFEASLYHIRKIGNNIVEKLVTLDRSSLNEGDCFMLDTGKLIYVWHGREAHPLEKYESNAAAERLVSRRQGQAESTHTLDDRFWTLLGGRGHVRAAHEASDEIPEPELGDGVLYKLTEESGKMEMFEVARGLLSRAMLDSDNVMILDNVSEICVWIGADASMAVTRSGVWAAYNFLKTNRRDLTVPIEMYKEGQQIDNKHWNAIFVERPLPQRAFASAP